MSCGSAGAWAACCSGLRGAAISARATAGRPQRALIFGEDATDRAALAELVVALCPALVDRVKLMAPPITIARDTTAARTGARHGG